MERVDFCSCMTVLRRYLQEDQMGNQLDLMYALFCSFLQSEEAASFDLDNGQVCRWLNGMAKVSPKITGFYLTGKEDLLAADIREQIFPYLSDPDMAIQEFCHLILQDPSVSERKKRALLEENGTDPAQQASFLADVLCLYIAYSGNLVRDISEMDFAEDQPEETEQDRFRRHNRFLRSL